MKKLYKVYILSMTLMLLLTLLTTSAFAVDDMWTVANTIIVDVYSKIAARCWPASCRLLPLLAPSCPTTSTR